MIERELTTIRLVHRPKGVLGCQTDDVPRMRCIQPKVPMQVARRYIDRRPCTMTLPSPGRAGAGRTVTVPLDTGEEVPCVIEAAACTRLRYGG
jgi:hypothetical protein